MKIVRQLKVLKDFLSKKRDNTRKDIFSGRTHCVPSVTSDPKPYIYYDSHNQIHASAYPPFPVLCLHTQYRGPFSLIKHRHTAAASLKAYPLQVGYTVHCQLVAQSRRRCEQEQHKKHSINSVIKEITLSLINATALPYKQDCQH